MYAIINKEHKYLTKRTIYSDFSFTNNEVWAYVWSEIGEAEELRNRLELSGIDDLEIVTI